MKKTCLFIVLALLASGCGATKESEKPEESEVIVIEATPTPEAVEEVGDVKPEETIAPTPQPTASPEPEETAEEDPYIGDVVLSLEGEGGLDSNDNVTASSGCTVLQDNTVSCLDGSTLGGIGDLMALDNGNVGFLYRQGMEYVDDEVVDANGEILRFFDVYGSEVPSGDAAAMLMDLTYYSQDPGEEDALAKVVELYPMAFSAGDFVEGSCAIRPLQVPEMFRSSRALDEETKEKVRQLAIGYGISWNIKATVNEGQTISVEVPEGYWPQLYFMPLMIQCEVVLHGEEGPLEVTGYTAEINDIGQAIGFYVVALRQIEG